MVHSYWVDHRVVVVPADGAAGAQEVGEAAAFVVVAACCGPGVLDSEAVDHPSD